MDDGGAATASAAANGQPEAAAIIDQLTAEQSTDTGFASGMAAQDTIWTGVTDSNSNSLVVPGGSGSVSVYTTESLGATTETGVALPSEDSFPTSSMTDYRFTINGGTSAPKIANYVDADAAMTYITEDADDSARAGHHDLDRRAKHPLRKPGPSSRPAGRWNSGQRGGWARESSSRSGLITSHWVTPSIRVGFDEHLLVSVIEPYVLRDRVEVTGHARRCPLGRSSSPGRQAQAGIRLGSDG